MSSTSEDGSTGGAPEDWYDLNLRVRYGETDQMGRAHHASYLHYLEDGRTRMMAARGCSYAELERRGIGLPVRKLDLRYRGAAAYDEELVVRTRVAGMRHASIRFDYEVRRASDGALLATASTELTSVDLARDPPKPMALPEELRSRIQASESA